MSTALRNGCNRRTNGRSEIIVFFQSHNIITQHLILRLKTRKLSFWIINNKATKAKDKYFWIIIGYGVSSCFGFNYWWPIIMRLAVDFKLGNSKFQWKNKKKKSCIVFNSTHPPSKTSYLMRTREHFSWIFFSFSCTAL